MKLNGEELKTLQQKLDPSWRIVDEHHLEKEVRFKNFAEALRFTNQIGALAEAENHHPDLHLSYGKVKIELWTHRVNGLTAKDFLFAANCDQIPL